MCDELESNEPEIVKNSMAGIRGKNITTMTQQGNVSKRINRETYWKSTSYSRLHHLNIIQVYITDGHLELEGKSHLLYLCINERMCIPVLK